ncbi:2179_t:CDS:1, partial [Paraglomus occultum]
DIFVDDTENANRHLTPKELVEEDPAMTEKRDSWEKTTSRLKEMKTELETFTYYMS